MIEISNIGYRINLENIININELLIEYSKFFNYYELKIKEYNILNDDIIQWLKISNKIGRCSLHLPKNLLDIKDMNFLKKLNKITLTNKTYCITHLNEKFNFKILEKKIDNILEYLPDNAILLLENPVIYANIEIWLYELNIFLEKYRYNNKVNICLDLGHYGYSCLFSNIEVNYLKLLNYENIISKIKELHLHGFNNKKDHLSLNDKTIDKLQIQKFYSEININCPIIIEANIIDGITGCINLAKYLIK